jgi:hypothetical protein
MKLQLPPLLRTLVVSGRWIHPGDEILRREVPLLIDPVDFRNGLPVDTVAAEMSANRFAPEDWEFFKMYRNDQPERPLPWLNADRAVFIAVNRIPGDDVAIALDYRNDLSIPHVVASHWRDRRSCEWFEVAPSFDAFARSLGLVAT